MYKKSQNKCFCLDRNEPVIDAFKVKEEIKLESLDENKDSKVDAEAYIPKVQGR